jgi:hypothetical protein
MTLFCQLTVAPDVAPVLGRFLRMSQLPRIPVRALCRLPPFTPVVLAGVDQQRNYQHSATTAHLQETTHES